MELTPRVPPHNNDAEISVLGSILLENDVLLQLGDTLSPEMFYREGHRKIFASMRNLQERGEPVDLVTLSDELTKRGTLDDVGGLTYLIGLSDQVPTSAYAEHYARLVQEKFTLRQLISASSQAMKLAYDGQLPLEDLLDKAEKMIFEVAEHKKKGDQYQAMSDVVQDTFEYITLLHSNKGIPDGVASGFRDLDEYISGLQKGSLNVLAARPSMGKTAFALSIAQNVALRGEKTVAVFSLEMPSVQLALRMLCSEARVDMNRIRSGQLNERDFERLAHAAGRLAEAPMIIDDEPDLTVNALRSKLRRIQAQHGNLGLVVIDYLQLMSGNKGNSGGNENRQQEISVISRNLKSIARELEVPVMVLSQLSRAVEQRPNHRPMLSDLRESGAIEQDADIVMFIYRDEYYNKETDQQGHRRDHHRQAAQRPGRDRQSAVSQRPCPLQRPGRRRLMPDNNAPKGRMPGARTASAAPVAAPVTAPAPAQSNAPQAATPRRPLQARAPRRPAVRAATATAAVTVAATATRPASTGPETSSAARCSRPSPRRRRGAATSARWLSRASGWAAS